MVQANIVKSPIVRQVLESIDRGHFIKDNPYDDTPQFIGNLNSDNRRQTISAPHMHAHVLEEFVPVLESRHQDRPIRILDVGCGSGYLTACFGKWIQLLDNKNKVSAQHRVCGIDVRPELIDFTKQNLANYRATQDQGSGEDLFRIELRDGWMGWSKEGPFDVIHVGAAAERLPIHLCQQLKVGGMMIVPVGAVDTVQSLYKVERVADEGASTSSSASSMATFVPEDFAISKLFGVKYVPLVQHPDEGKAA